MTRLSDPLPLADHRIRVREYLCGIAPSFSSVAGEIIEQRDPPARGAELLRPTLVLWACAACGGDGEDALPVAAAFDLFDRFMQLHDELVEGEPATVARWGLGQSLNAGDALYALAFRSLAENISNADRRLAVAAVVTRAVLGAIEGRNDDVARGRADGLLARVRSVNRRSAGLTGAALQAGALLAGAPGVVARAFLRAGRLLDAAGLASDTSLSTRVAEKAIAAVARCAPEPRHLAAFEEVAHYLAARAA